MHYDHIELVYLSACRTALTEKIPDEGVHLASAFQLAGARQVIGTLWDVNDAIAADVAATFYSSLRTEDANLDTGHAAAALHHAVRSVRDAYPHTPSLWAGYLHVGA